MMRARTATARSRAPNRRARAAHSPPVDRHARTNGVVVTYSPGKAGAPDGHDALTREGIARRLATFMGFPFEGEYDASRRYDNPPYFVPGITLSSEAASDLGIRGELDLFGGVVPYPFVATKAITHPLVAAASRAPEGWCAEFSRRVAGVVLDGFSAFAREDALEAGRQLLKDGSARVKLVTGIAGRGQTAVDNPAELEDALSAIDDEQIAAHGVVIEQNLTDVITYSVGQIRVAGFFGTYCGTQCATTNNRGEEIYGGSDLIVVAGDFDALLDLPLTEEIRLAIGQARVYDEAAAQCFTGYFASRRNYDIALGLDFAGRRRSGVLEQSWRLGGASGAEIGALEAFRADPSLRAVRAMTREIYGEPPLLPPHAAVYFSGADPRLGSLTKYAWTEPYADTR